MATTVLLKDIKTDPAGDMLVKGKDMRPYINHYKAVLSGEDSNATLKIIAGLPSEKRYLSRVVQCLDWALADFDSETAKLDMPYISDLDEVQAKLQHRLMQLNILFQTLKG